MAPKIVLHYFPSNSPLHRWDARCKLLALPAVTLMLLHGNPLILTLYTAILFGLLILSGLPIMRFLRDLRTWWIFLGIIFLFQVLFTSGPRLPGFLWLPVSKEGLRLGILICWRLALILGYAVLFTAVTRSRDLQDGILWFLSPFPSLPRRRIGLMVSLTLRFFTTVLDQSEEIRLAHKARLGDQRRNPFRMAKFMALPVIRRAFCSVEEVTLALVARGYREDLPARCRILPFTHLIPLLFLFVMSLVIWLLLL